MSDNATAAVMSKAPHAKRFSDKLPQSVIDTMRKTPVPWGPLGYVTYKRCVDIDTPVLCDDLVWRKAGDLTVGQGLIGFDEEPVQTGMGQWRYIQHAEVTHNTIEEAETMGIELEDGTIVYATPDHSWLVKMASNKNVWRETKDLEASSKDGPVYLLRPFGKPWEKDDSYEAGYLAGAYDGEGNIDRLNGAAFVQVENKMLRRVETFLNERGITYKKSLRSSVEGRQPCYGLRFSGVKNLFRLFGETQPVRIMERLRTYLQSDKKLPALRCDPEDLVKVIRVFPAGVRKIAVMSTSSKTHFTAGFASHNTYSRLREDLGRKEEWLDTTVRCINGLLRYGMVMKEDELTDLANFWYNLKIMPAGRGLWQLGTKTVDKVGGDSLMNCHFVNISDVEAFTFVFDELMLGGGVGYSILPSVVHKLPKVKRKLNIARKDSNDVSFIIPDNREGWVDLLRRVLNAYFTTGKDFSYSTNAIRSKGAPIAGFGGMASGPEELAKGIGQISNILNNRARKHIRPVDALDILNIIGSIVVSGNVRRSAQIALGHVEDKEFLYAKNWSTGTIPNWRAMSNNTCVCNDIANLTDDFWGGYEGNGEPYGLFNLDLARRYGRLADGEDHRPDLDVDGVNPCAEQTLEDGECCCLVEQCLPRYSDKNEFIKGAGLIYKVAKTMISMPFSWPKAQAVVEKNRRIGIGVTGITQAKFKPSDYGEVYRYLENLDAEYSQTIGVNPSIKLTTTKPSGTVSLLPGVTPGVHPAYAEYYIRRIRFAADDKLVNELRKRNYHVENVIGFDGRPDPNTVVASFPVKTPAGTLLAKNTTAIKQLELQRMVQTNWSDNAVSVTVYYRKEELPEIKEYLKKNYKDGIKSVSFLLHNEHGFHQAPYEEIAKSVFEDMSKNIVPITNIEETEENDIIEGLECAGACPTR